MRLGINVPNDLIQRVKATQPDVNISQICREALEELAERRERAIQRVSNTDFSQRIEEFLASEKAPIVEPDWVGYALEDAEHWVNNISADDWADFCEDYKNTRKGQGESDLWHWYWYVPECKTFLQRELENEDWVRRQFKRGGDPTAPSNAGKTYADTWMSYIETVILKQQEIWEARWGDIQTERIIAREASSVPKVPPHLAEESKIPIKETTVRNRRIVMWDFQNVAVAASDIQRVDGEIMKSLDGISTSSDHDLFKAFCRPDQHAATEELKRLKWRVKERKDDLDPALFQECRSDCGQAPTDTILVICTKDGDFAKLVEEMRESGVQVYVMGPKNSSQRLIRAAGSGWIDLN